MDGLMDEEAGGQMDKFTDRQMDLFEWKYLLKKMNWIHFAEDEPKDNRLKG